MKRLRIRWPLYLLPASEVDVIKKIHKQTPAQKLATKHEELDYWYLAMMDRPHDDIAHEEFCNSVTEVQRAKGNSMG